MNNNSEADFRMSILPWQSEPWWKKYKNHKKQRKNHYVSFLQAQMSISEIKKKNTNSILQVQMSISEIKKYTLTTGHLTAHIHTIRMGDARCVCCCQPYEQIFVLTSIFNGFGCQHDHWASISFVRLSMGVTRFSTTVNDLTVNFVSISTDRPVGQKSAATADHLWRCQTTSRGRSPTIATTDVQL